MDKISIVIVDDHPLFRQGVWDALSLEKDFELVGDAGDGKEGFLIIKAKRPNIAILDVNVPGYNGYQITYQIHAEKIPTRVILVTAYDDPEQIFHAMRAGASGYCAKNIRPDALAQVIRNVSAGYYAINEMIMDQNQLESWLQEQGIDEIDIYKDQDTAAQTLSSREMEVLILITKGLSNKEIATTLGISNQTIKNHVTSILRKLGVEDRTQAAIFALKKGWVRVSH